ncbi:MAG: DUF488 family protein [Sphingobacteriales bacterium]|nr:MAG: DUF488 family protein [Sphingobacteriales bacterium]
MFGISAINSKANKKTLSEQAKIDKQNKAELKASASIDELRSLAHQHPVITLLYGAKDETHNQAAALKQFLLS